MVGSHYSCQMQSHTLSSLNLPRYESILNVYLYKLISKISYTSLAMYIALQTVISSNLLKHWMYTQSQSHRTFFNTMHSNSLMPLIFKLTRETYSTATLIDNILTNHYDVNDQLCQGIFSWIYQTTTVFFIYWINTVQLMTPPNYKESSMNLGLRNIKTAYQILTGLLWMCMKTAMENQTPIAHYRRPKRFHQT